MIKGIYETHLQVRDLKRSSEFYEKIGLKIVHTEPRVSFFQVGVGTHPQLLGLWQVPQGDRFSTRHFAFRVDLDFLLQSKLWLSVRGINTVAVFGRGNEEPIVHVWEPSAAIYFNDPDDNQLEFCCHLSDRPQNLDFVPTWSEWQNISLR